MILPVFLLAIVFLAAWSFLSVTGVHSSRRPLAAILLTLAFLTVAQVLLSYARLLDRNHLAALTVLTAVPTLVLAVLYQLLDGMPTRLLPPKPGTAAIVWTLLVLAVYLWVARVGALFPPLAWDTLTYHYPLLLHARAEHAMLPFPFPARNAFYPLFGEIVSLWNLVLSTGDPWAAMALGGLPFVGLGAAACYSLAVTLELPRARRILPVLFALTPIVLIQSTSGYVDLAFASLFLAATAFLLGWLKEGRGVDLRFFALAMGGLFATKLVILYFGLPLFLLWIAGRKRARKDWHAEIRTIGKDLPALVLLFLLLPGYWQARNAVLTGNPIYPTPVRIAGHTLLEGPKEPAQGEHQEEWFVSSPAGWLAYPFRETAFGAPRYSVENGFGATFPLGLLGTVLALVAAARKKERLLFLVLLAVPVTILLWLTVHLYREPRYILYVAPLALLGPLRLAESMPRSRRHVVHLLLVAGGIFSAALTLPRLVPHAIEIGPRLRTGDFETRELYALEFGRVAEGWQWLADRTRGEAATIGFTSGELVAPLYGAEGRNRLVYVHPGDTPYPHAREAEDAASYAEALRDAGARYLFAATPKWAPGASQGAEWARGDTVSFPLLRDFGGEATVHRVRGGGAAGPRGAFPFPVEIDLEGLADPALWAVEYAEGATITVGAAPDTAGGPPGGMPGGIALAWSFQTAGNDYAEVAARPGRMDMSGHEELRFRLVSDLPRGELFVYLKEGDESRQMRFHIPLAGLQPGGGEVKLAFDRPERRTEGFDLRRVQSIHLVLDDEPDRDAGDGRLAIRGFRLANVR